MPRYLEDLREGETFTSSPQVVTEDEMLAFARQFDPQPFHADPHAARDSFFGRLVASGWHTAALTMRHVIDAGMDLAGGVIGAGVEALRWPAPLAAGESIHVRVTILGVRASQSRPTMGIVRFRVDTLRGDGTPVQEMTGNLIVPRRPAN